MTHHHENLAASTAGAQGINPPVLNRDGLGRRVREMWIEWARTQPEPKPSWLIPYDELSEPDKEADRQIGEALWAIGMQEGTETLRYCERKWSEERGTMIDTIQALREKAADAAAAFKFWNDVQSITAKHGCLGGDNVLEWLDARLAALASPPVSSEPVAMIRALHSLAEASRAVLKTLKPGQSLTPAGAALTNRLDSITAEIEASLSLARSATVSSAVPRAWEIVTKPGNVPDYTSFPTVAEQARRDGKLVTPLYAVQVSSAVPVKVLTSAWLGYWPGAGSIDSVTRVTRSEHVAKRWAAEGAEVTELIERSASPQDRAAVEPLQNPQQLDRAAIIEECAKVADKWADEYGDPADTMHAAHGVARAIRALIGDTK